MARPLEMVRAKKSREKISMEKGPRKNGPVKGITEKFTEGSLIYLFYSWIRAHQKMLNAHPTIPHTPNCGKRACGDRFSRGPFFRGFFSVMVSSKPKENSGKINEFT